MDVKLDLIQMRMDLVDYEMTINYLDRDEAEDNIGSLSDDEVRESWTQDIEGTFHLDRDENGTLKFDLL
jgi:hypothetical protein